MPKIKILKDEVVFDGEYMKTIRRHFVGRTGEPLYWEMMERKTHGRIVAIVPITPKNEIILVKIYRIPFKTYIIEPCAGLKNGKEEDEGKAALRELLEETGYSAARTEKLVTGPFDTGRSSDEMTVYLARNAVKVQDQNLEEAEDIEVLKIPLKKLYHTLTHPPRGVKVDMKLFGILYLLERKGYNF